MSVIDRFLKYIEMDTTSNSKMSNPPSSDGQLLFARELINELYSLNIDNVYFDSDHCYVYATLKGDEDLPKVGFISHLDTSESASGKNIKAKFTSDYDGGDITLGNGIVLSPKEYPDLSNHIGKTIITSDGSTLLGADDKAGIAEIMTMLEYFSSSKEKHGDILVCFTPDEEIGLSEKYFNKEYFKPDVAYTVDGSTVGEFSYENFNAASAKIDIEGISTHTGSAKDKMINAVRIATLIQSLLPNELPENTEGYEGFYHLEEINGDITNAHMEYLIRDFDKGNMERRKKILQGIVYELNMRYGNAIKLEIVDTYFNMYDVIKEEKELIDNTKQAISNTGTSVIVSPIRGGTDGARISYMGIPCPNIGTGGHNFHSVYEYICVEDMEKSCEILTSIVKEFSKCPPVLEKK